MLYAGLMIFYSQGDPGSCLLGAEWGGVGKGLDLYRRTTSGHNYCL